MPRQLPLDLAIRQARSRDDLVVTPANSAAVELIDRWPDWSSPVVVVAGPQGAGKSHLGAIWQEKAGARALERTRIVAGDGVGTITEPLFLDDADSQDLDEAGLFHAINAVREAGMTMLVTARRFPAAWGVSLPDLASRLKAATVVEIGEPDDGLLAAVTAKLFADRQVEVEPHVIQFLVRRMERSLAAAMRVVERLDALALEQKSRITRAMAADVIEAIDHRQGELDFSVSISDVAQR